MHRYILMLQELWIFIYTLLLSQNINDTIMKSAQAASEIKPTLQQIYINKFNRKLKSMEKATTISSKKKPSKSWWIQPYFTEWKKFTHHLKMPQKIQEKQQKKLIDKHIMSSIFSPINNRNKSVNSSSDMEIIKITTVVEAIRQKRQNSAQMLKETKDIEKIISKKRSKRSFYKLGNNATVRTKDSKSARQEKTFVSNKKSRYLKPNSQKQQIKISPMRKRSPNKSTDDLKAVNNAAIPVSSDPSTVFYKRIWEYINGTRPHSDIIGNYNPLENKSEKNNSTCTDKEQITSSNIKPERAFYKRIWDIINATRAKGRFKRNATIPKSNVALTPLCVQEGAVNYKESKQVQTTNEKASLGITDTINSPEISNSSPHTSGFWTVANITQWQPKKIPVVNIATLNNDPILSPLVSSASEVDDLNKFPNKIEHVTHSSSNNSTEHNNKTYNSSQEIITEPGPPYSSEESFATSSPTENAVDKDLQQKSQVERVENYSTATTPGYDPLNIPYVEVPDYSDQQEDSLDKSNQSATATRYKEYDDSDYDHGPKWLDDADDFSSKSLNAEIKVVQAETNEPSLNANDSRSNCAKSKNSAECIDNYDVEDTKLRNNTENVSNNRSAEDSAESGENENSDFVDFDINEYKKPLNWLEFFKNDPILESIRANFSKEYDHRENSDRTEESEEVETYATDPTEKSHDYFGKNEDFHDDYGIALNNRNEEEKEKTDFYAKKEAKESKTIDKDHYPNRDKDFLKHVFGKNNDKELECNYNENSPKKSEEVETYNTKLKEHKEKPDRIEESEEVETYATDPKEQSQDYFVENQDYYDNQRIASNDRGETNNTEKKKDIYAKKKTKKSDEDHYPYDDKDFFKLIFEEDNDKESSDTVDTENEFLSRHFTEDVLRQMRDNSTNEEDRRREESKYREDIQKTLSSILNKKDRFSRLDDNLNEMIEKGEAVPIKYNNFWSLKYESPRNRNDENNEEKTEDSKEGA